MKNNHFSVESAPRALQTISLTVPVWANNKYNNSTDTIAGEEMGEYVEVDLMRTTDVAGVITQGRGAHQQWVTRFKVAYFESEGASMQYVQDQQDQDKVSYYVLCDVSSAIA